jgi:WD40 repeat protein
MLKRSILIAILLITTSLMDGYGQDCRPPLIVFNNGAGNMFSPEQEMILGDLTMQRISNEFRKIKDPSLQRYIDDIGAKLIKHLPSSGLKFSFHIIDYPDANAFNTTGGHVYISRKLISFVNSEDELAGVIAHELGHATVHHGAIDMSTYMRVILKVTSVGDRKDITEKYNLLIENVRTKRIPAKRGHEDNQQVEADRIALFSMAAAGYNSEAFQSFFDRLAETEGKTGSWFSDIFGQTSPDQKRLREMQAVVSRLPQECRDAARTSNTETFSRWQAEVVMYRERGRREELPGLIMKKELQAKLRSDISHMAFSPDGSILLVQDEFAITLIKKTDWTVAFQIPAEGAEEATFADDGKQVVFLTDNLRFERWDIGLQKPVEVREIVILDGYLSLKLSPDGNYLACIDYGLNARLIDMKTGKKVWEKKEIYRLSFVEYLILTADYVGIAGPSFFRIEFSPDSRYALFSRSHEGRPDFYSFYAGSNDAAVAVDIPAKKVIAPGGDIDRIASHGYAFIDADRIVGNPSGDPKNSGIFSFPDGKRLQKFAMGGSSVSRTENPDVVVVRPMVETKLGIFDIKRGVIVAGMNKEEAAFWSNLIAFETVGGKVLIRELSGGKGLEGNDIATVDIPITSIGNLRAAGTSNSFGWLSISAKSRGGMWNLATGERKIFTRGFTGTIVADDGGAVSFFPRMGETANALALMNPIADQVTNFRNMPDKGARQYGRFVLLRSNLKDDAVSEKDEKNKLVVAGEVMDSPRDVFRGQGIRLEIKDMITDQVIWSREFKKFPPRFTFDELSGRLIIYASLKSEAGQAKLKESPELQEKVAALGNKFGDSVIEVFDSYAKKTIGLTLVESGKGSFYVTRGTSAGDWLVLYDSENRVLAYSIKDGTLKQRFFGQRALVNPRKNELLVENFPGEINLYDLESGESKAKIVFDGEVIFARYNLEGTKLFLLNDAQTAYIFDLSRIRRT